MTKKYLIRKLDTFILLDKLIKENKYENRPVITMIDNILESVSRLENNQGVNYELVPFDENAFAKIKSLDLINNNEVALKEEDCNTFQSVVSFDIY